MKNKINSAFTLVELIVVITILAILGTIAFISLQGYSSNARDSARISDINNLKTSLELYRLNSLKYPIPDDSVDITYSGGSVVIWKQGKLGDVVTSQLSKNINKKPLDPLYKKEYTYSTLENGNQYQIMAVFESDLLVKNLLDFTYAATTPTVKVDGTYNGLYIKTANYIIPSPSIITSLNPVGLDLNISTIESQVIDGGTNIPDLGTSKVAQSTGALTFSSFEVYNGNLNKNSDIGDFLYVYKTLLNTYSGSSLENYGMIKSLLTQASDEGKVNFINNIATNNNNPLSVSDWRDIDSNCDKPDVNIGTQTWAGCNSTILDGLEYGKNDDGTNGTILTCYKAYDAVTSVPADCVIDSTVMASNTKANTWFTGTNANGDIEFDNIWGKFYTGDNYLNACAYGYHVPTDAEFEYAEEYLFEADGGLADCRTLDNWNCDGAGWNLHSTTNNTNNMVEILGLPLSGFRDTDSTSYKHRGYRAPLWSSTKDVNGDQTGRLFGSNSEGLYRSFWSTSFAFSVRCIKD